MRVSSKKDQISQISDAQATKPTIHIVELLDRSGSMQEQRKYQEAEKGINHEIDILQKNNTANYTMTIAEFDIGHPISHYSMEDISKVKTFKGKGPRGMTALYDAIGTTINEIAARIKKDDRVLFNIFTDGGENASRSFSAESIKSLIEKVKKENNFTVTFIGTKFDVDQMIKDTGISRGNTYTYDGTGKGTRMSQKARTGATIMYASSVAAGATTVDNFFEKEIEGDK